MPFDLFVTRLATVAIRVSLVSHLSHEVGGNVANLAKRDSVQATDLKCATNHCKVKTNPDAMDWREWKHLGLPVVSQPTPTCMRCATTSTSSLSHTGG